MIRPSRSVPRTLPPWVAMLCLLLLLGAGLATVHEPRRWAQVMVFAVGPLAWLAVSVGPGLRTLRGGLLWAWTMLFAVDAAVRGYLLQAYGAAPNASIVVGSMANTHADEAAEFVALAWPELLPWVLAVVAAGVLCAVLLRAAQPVGDAGRRPAPVAPVLSRRARIALLAALLPVSAAGYGVRPWRRQHPLVFWPEWTAEVAATRDNWAALERWRDAVRRRAREEAPRVAFAGASTLVIVIGDSVNRDNLGLYGYPRDTTPRLDAREAALGDALLVFREAWSVDFGTIPALRSLFQFGATEPGDTAHLLALARDAGYRVHWISNHDDAAIEAVHAGFADEQRMLSRTPGRATRSPDDVLLEPLARALADPAPRKLVVVHAMGAHPHYRLRYPAGANPFDDTFDEIDRELMNEGRPFWVRSAREHYDAALRHHDGIVARCLDLCREHAAGTDGPVAWVYLSDHGQEVGHDADRAGHSATTLAGYAIPLLVWRREPGPEPAAPIESRPFRADWGAWMLAGLLGLQWAGRRPERDLLDPAYRWEPPEVIARFDRNRSHRVPAPSADAGRHGSLWTGGAANRSRTASPPAG